MKSNMRILAAAVLLALAPMAQAQATSSQLDAQATVLDQTAASRGQVLVAQKIASNFTGLAGSEENAVALVNALRTGDTVKLTYSGAEGSTPTVTTVDPPTSKMGWGNVKISLALAQDALARAGITNPTGEQLQAALNGGSVTVKNPDGTTTTTKLTGILQMRADGMGWGEIAKASGTKVGPVVSQLKMANTKVKALPPEPTSTASAPATGKSVTTATSGSSKPATSKGITTATGSGGGSTHGSKGLTTATGAAGNHGSRGLVTADGAVAGSAPKGNAHGRGVVTAAGGSATNVAATGAGNGRGHGAGVVTATGGSASSGVTNANGGGNGKGQGNGKGRGGG
jgi:hypothetical protein